MQEKQQQQRILQVVSEKLQIPNMYYELGVLLLCFYILYLHFSEPLDTVVPNVGFSSVSLTHRGCSVVIYDLGGGPQIRGIWHRYFVDVSKLLCVQVLNEVKYCHVLWFNFPDMTKFVFRSMV
jgi:hypothetical protein